MLLGFKFDDIGNGPPLDHLLRQTPPIQRHTGWRRVVVAVDIVVVAPHQLSSVCFVIVAAPCNRVMVSAVDLSVPSPLRSNQ